MTRICSILAAAVCVVASVNAYTTPLVGTSVSAFGGRVLLTGNDAASGASATLTMKKGANVPPQMRANYKRQKEVSQMRQEMEAAQQPGSDGLPVFNLFVRSPVGNMWYPCGSFKGDDKSAALATSWRDNGFMSGMSKNQLDSGIAGSLYRDIPQLEGSIFRTYPQLRKSKGKLEYGYKLAFEGLSEEQSKISQIEPKEMKGFLDGIKGSFGL